MNNWGTVISGYVFTGVGLGAYATWIVVRGRSIGRDLGIGNKHGKADGEDQD
ncbi:MAG: hypothetical protein ACI8Y4_003546 [Candidatus Poriferisodalaceae bacterium]|jgi:hypothetical protein